MRDLPDHDRLYEALLARDPGYEGVALVGVTSTGIYCRLTCPSRKPRPENCRWFGDAAEAQVAGFRPCLRCRPSGPQAEAHPVVAGLLRALKDRPDHRWTQGDLVALDFDGSAVVPSALRAELSSDGAGFEAAAGDDGIAQGGFNDRGTTAGRV